MSDCVYFVQAGDDGPIKIGCTCDVQRRLAGLRRRHAVSVAAVHACWDAALDRDDDAAADAALDELVQLDGLPLTLVLLGTLPGYEALEAYFHRLFALENLPYAEAAALHLPHPTEWFRPSITTLLPLGEMKT